MSARQQKIGFGIFLLLVAIVIYGLNYFTPMSCDDWAYVFVFGSENERINSLWDIIRSQHYHYFEWNGRAVVHTVLQAVDSFLGKGIFNVLNTAVFILFLYAFAINTTGEKRHYYKIFSVSFILIFLLFPGFNTAMLWLSGSFNYLWVGTALLFFHHMLEQERYSRKAYVPLFLCGFLCGWTNEAFVVGLAAAYFIYYATHRELLTTPRVIMLAGFFIGAILLVLSPASIHRAMNTGSSHNHSLRNLAYSLIMMDNMRVFFIMVITVAALSLTRQLNFKQWIKKEMLLIMAVIFSIGFIVFTTYDSGYSRTGIETYSLVLLLRCIPWDRISNSVLTVANAFTLVVGVLAIQACHQCYLVNKEEISQIERHEYPIQTTMPDYNPLFDRYIVPYCYSPMGPRFKAYGRDTGTSQYFNHDNIYYLPRDFVQRATRHPEQFSTFQTGETWPFYAVRATGNENEKTYALIEFEPTDYSELKWTLRLIARKMPEYYGNTVPVEVEKITLNDIDYILVDKNLTPHRKVKRIILKDDR